MITASANTKATTKMNRPKGMAGFRFFGLMRIVIFSRIP